MQSDTELLTELEKGRLKGPEMRKLNLPNDAEKENSRVL